MVPCIASSSSALSATVRASGPYVLRPSQCSPSGIFDTRPRVGFIPTRPQHAAGIRIDPPPSEPVANGTRPAATADADPPEDPPGVRSGLQGLRVIPVASLAVHGKMVSSGTFVIPIGIAPAARSRRTTSASATSGGPCVLEPRVVGCPATGVSPLIAMGTPASGPSASTASAAASASSGIVVRNAFSFGSIASIRRRQASTSSRGWISPARTRSASALGPAKTRSSSALGTRVPSQVMTDRVQTIGSNGAAADLDAAETREWLEAIDAVIAHDGPGRARQILQRVVERAQHEGTGPIASLNTPYVNTIPPELEARLPGDPALERRLRSIVRWNAMAMVIRANKESSDLGGHIASYQSLATLYEVGFNHFWRAPTSDFEGDLVYFQGHSSPGNYARAYLEGRLSNEQLDGFRREVSRPAGLSSYPHPWLMPDFLQLPTVSLGSGAITSIYQARLIKYLRPHPI